MGELLASLALVLYSVNVILTRIATRHISVNLGYEVSTLVIIAFALLLVAGRILFGDTPLVWNPVGFFAFMCAGMFTTFVGRWLSYQSIARFGPARATVFQLGVPLLTVAIAWLFLDERLTTLTLLGIPVAVCGLFVVVYVPGAFGRHTAGLETIENKTARRRKLLQVMAASSAIMGLGLALAYALGNVWRGLAMRHWNEPVVGGLVGAISGLLLYLLVMPGARKLRSHLKGANQFGIAVFAGIGILNIMAQIFSIVSLRYLPVSISGLIVSCIPILVIPMSYFLLKSNEGISARSIAGTALTLFGIAMVLLGRT